MRLCAGCLTDISHRHGLAKRCEACAQANRNESARQWKREHRDRIRMQQRARYNLVYAKGVRTCVDCGGPCARDKNRPVSDPRCVSCALKVRTTWTRENIIAAIREFHEAYGRTPTAQDWNPSMAATNGRDDIVQRWYDDACWPSSTSVQEAFGRWSAGIEAAGFTPRKAGGRGPDSEFRRAEGRRMARV